MERSKHPCLAGLPSKISVLIVGGGPAGSAAAITLGRAGIPTLLVDAGDSAQYKIGETVPPPIRNILAALGVWETFRKAGHLPSRGTCSAWGASTLGVSDYLFSPLGSGFHLNRERFDRDLFNAAKTSGAITAPNIRVTNVVEEGEGIRATLLADAEEPHTIEAKYLLDATGRRATVARSLGAQRITTDNLVAAAAFFPQEGEAPFGAHALIEAVSTGFWYAAPLPNSRFVVAFFTDADIMHEQALSQPEAWLAELNSSQHANRTAPKAAPQIVVYAAGTSQLDKKHGGHWLAIGDAACTFDPLSSAGITKALISGKKGAEVVREAIQGNTSALEEEGRRATEDFNAFLRERHFHYARETRFPNAAFWKRRNE